MKTILTATVSIFALTLSGLMLPASAQTASKDANAQASDSAGKTSQDRGDLSQWTYEELYSKGWSAEALLDTDVYGPDGKEIGELENVLVGADGKIDSAIIEAGGFLEIADTHFRVPWDEVEISQDMDRITVPVTEGNAEDYAIFEGEYVPVERREFRVTELIDDYALIENRMGYGYVDDAIFRDDGQLLAVVVEPDVTYGPIGPYAYPFYGYGYGFDPGLDYYTLPYAEAEVAELDSFNYEAMNNGPGSEQAAKKPSSQKQPKTQDSSTQGSSN